MTPAASPSPVSLTRSLALACTGLLSVSLALAGCGAKKAAPTAKQSDPAADKAPSQPRQAYFEDALKATVAGQAAKPDDTKPYGCGVKYGPDAKAPASTAQIGQPAPDFTLTDLQGKSVKLSDFRGKTVVLEWYNPECPFVEHAYMKGPLKGLATQSGGEVVWLNINSGAPGKQGTGKDKNLKYAKDFGITHPILLDEDGAVGQLYGAKTTPHLFIVDREGKLVYRGALDNAPFGKTGEA